MTNARSILDDYLDHERTPRLHRQIRQMIMAIYSGVSDTAKFSSKTNEEHFRTLLDSIARCGPGGQQPTEFNSSTQMLIQATGIANWVNTIAVNDNTWKPPMGPE